MLRELLALERAFAVASGSSRDDLEFCEKSLRDTPAEEIDPPWLISGDQLREMGLVPGPQFKDLLEAVRDAQLDGRIATRAEALEYVRMLTGPKPGFPG